MGSTNGVARERYLANARERAAKYRAAHLEAVRQREREYAKRPEVKARKALYDIVRRQRGLVRKYHAPHGACQICGRSEKLLRDHDHKTGKMRGLLCRACNFAIGLACDDPKILESAIAYLRRWA